MQNRLNIKAVEIPFYRFHTDRLGSGSVVTDGSGRAVHVLSYMPYGETLLDLSQGYEKYSESGLSYAGARYHDSDLSMFLSVDRFAEKFPWQSVNLFLGN